MYYDVFFEIANHDIQSKSKLLNDTRLYMDEVRSNSRDDNHLMSKLLVLYVYIYKDKSQQRGINNYTALSIKDLFIAFVITFVNSC